MSCWLEILNIVVIEQKGSSRAKECDKDRWEMAESDRYFPIGNFHPAAEPLLALGFPVTFDGGSFVVGALRPKGPQACPLLLDVHEGRLLEQALAPSLLPALHTYP
jgi:hypothetical protein